jgi:hypothetical protein
LTKRKKYDILVLESNERKKKMKAIYFDMDGTIANLYGVENWLSYLINEQTKPYREAKPLINMRELGRELNRVQNIGYQIGVVSWLSKGGSEEYNRKVTATKKTWLKKHLGSVEWDEIHIVEYGTPKSTVVRHSRGILFDDEKGNRLEWNREGMAFDVKNILEVLRNLQ